MLLSKTTATRAFDLLLAHRIFRLSCQQRVRSVSSHHYPTSNSISGATLDMTVVDTNLSVLDGAPPTNVWRFFAELSSIPRPSGHEEKVLQWLKDFAAQRHLDCVQDSVGNIIICRPGSGTGTTAPPVILQGHVDMVTEKNADVAHDFMNDPITWKRWEGGPDDWLSANGTTLGADNGIGVCAALAVLDMPPHANLPPIEALFTVDEERGLTGAFQLEGSLLQGRTMINLDTEEWPEVFIGCAGGGDSVLTLPVRREKGQPGGVEVAITVTGLKGGHSGVEIHEDRGNALRLVASTVDTVLSTLPTTRLVGMQGGDKRNAIPREATARLAALLPQDVGSIEAIVAQREREFKEEYGSLETELKLGVAVCSPDTPSPPPVIVPTDTKKLLNLLLTLPHGVIKYSHTVPGLVETSSNLASITSTATSTTTTGEEEVTYRIQCSTRSSLMPPLERVRGMIRRIGEMAGAGVEQEAAYPGWQPRPDAPIVALAKAAIASVAGRTPHVKAIHAGLECGIIGEKLPGCESVSYGPTIRGAHSPDERVQISTVEPFWKATVALLESLAGAA